MGSTQQLVSGGGLSIGWLLMVNGLIAYVYWCVIGCVDTVH